MTPNYKIIFVAFMQLAYDASWGLGVGELKCGVYCDKGNGGGTRKWERDREIQREGGRERRQRDRKLPPQRNGRKEESRSRQGLSLKETKHCLPYTEG